MSTSDSASTDDFKEGLDNFFTKPSSLASPAGTGHTPVGSPHREDNLSRHGSISSSSSFTRSKEDIRDLKHSLKVNNLMISLGSHKFKD